jgi:hypothetical protein
MSEKKPPEKTRRIPIVSVVQPDTADGQAKAKKPTVAELRAKVLSEARTAIDNVAKRYERHPELAVLLECLRRAVQDME